MDTMSATELNDQLSKHQLTLTVDGKVIPLPKESRVRKAVADGIAQGNENGPKVLMAIGHGTVKLANATALVLVDEPVAGVKAMGRAMSRGHAKRMDRHATNKAARKAKRAEREAAKAKAMAEADATPEVVTA